MAQIKEMDTDTGAALLKNIQDLLELLSAYETGKIKERV